MGAWCGRPPHQVTLVCCLGAVHPSQVTSGHSQNHYPQLQQREHPVHYESCQQRWLAHWECVKLDTRRHSIMLHRYTWFYIYKEKTDDRVFLYYWISAFVIELFKTLGIFIWNSKQLIISDFKILTSNIYKSTLTQHLSMQISSLF